jgi:hypothetical protein
MSSSVADVARQLHLDVEVQTHAIAAAMKEQPRLVRTHFHTFTPSHFASLSALIYFFI